jgi:hypothetical protein
MTVLDPGAAVVSSARNHFDQSVGVTRTESTLDTVQRQTRVPWSDQHPRDNGSGRASQSRSLIRPMSVVTVSSLMVWSPPTAPWMSFISKWMASNFLRSSSVTGAICSLTPGMRISPVGETSLDTARGQRD